MPTNRTRIPRALAQERITPAAIAAWQAGDYWALHAALGLYPWQMPEWGDDPIKGDDRPDSLRRAYPVPDVVALRAALIAVAGPPPRRWSYRHADK